MDQHLRQNYTGFLHTLCIGLGLFLESAGMCLKG